MMRCQMNYELVVKDTELKIEMSFFISVCERCHTSNAFREF